MPPKGVSREDESPPTLIPSWGEKKRLWRAGVQISTAGFLMLRYADFNSKTRICCPTLPLPAMEKAHPSDQGSNAMVLEETPGLTPGHRRGVINHTLSDRSKAEAIKAEAIKACWSPVRRIFFQAKTTIV